MQALRAAKHRGKRFEASAHDVVHVLRLRERRRRSLAMEAQAHRFWILRAKPLLHDLGVDPANGPELRDFLEEVHLAHEEEGEPWRKLVHVHPSLLDFLDIGDEVGHREGHLVQRRGAGLRDVVPRDVDRVVALHVLGAVSDAIAHDPH